MKNLHNTNEITLRAKDAIHPLLCYWDMMLKQIMNQIFIVKNGLLKMKIYKKVSSRIFSTTNIKHNIFRKIENKEIINDESCQFQNKK